MSVCAMESLQQPPPPRPNTQTTATPFPNHPHHHNTSTVVVASATTSSEEQLLNRVSDEIERMRVAPTSNSITSNSNNNNNNNNSSSFAASSSSSPERSFHSFPPACLEMLKNIKGNHRCVDCGEQNPQWAACRYGALLCLNCSGHHRSLGVQISSVRSISMDEWSVNEVISMLEGGNSQLTAFFDRHALTQHACSLVTLPPSPLYGTDGRPNPNGITSSSVAATTTTSMINRDNVMRLRYKTKAALFYRRNMEQHVSTILNTGPYRGREISRQHYKNCNSTNPQQQEQQQHNVIR